MKEIILLATSMLLSAQILAAPTEKAVLEQYADVAHAMYEDALITARALQQAVGRLVENPTEDNLAAARSAWKAARIPYQQTEALRFGNAIVDAWEGKVNSWPLDEGLIDYVTAAYGTESDENPYFTANVIASEKLMLSGRVIDAHTIDKTLLAESLHELDGVEANVATGYHAIEFLLWGQDLNGTGPGAGARPASDFDNGNCTGGHCQRRAAYLTAATGLLVDDLGWMTEQWTSGGAARNALLEGDPRKGLATILTGMGSLSYGELAGERMKLGLMLHDPEEEQDCFSDNTHWSHFYDAKGMQNVYTGSYQRVDGSRLEGASISELVAARDPQADQALRARLNETLAKMQVIVDSAEHDGVAYDQLIAAGNQEGNAKVMAAIHALLAQTKAIEQAVSLLELDTIAFEGSDSLDAPKKINQ
jgi:putative iron-regulated protein